MKNHQYRTRAIIYCIFFTPFFNAAYIQERLILQTIYVLNKGNLDLKSEVYNQEQFQIKSGL